MKVVLHKLDRLLRLSAAAGLLLIGQQALAVGTDAGTPIDNTAVITYEVNNVTQDPLNAVAPQFVVDRVVNFTLDTADAALTPTAPGETGAIVLYTLTNVGNSPLDFVLDAVNVTTGDEDDMVDTSFVAFVDSNGNGVLDGAETDFVDALPEGDSVTITVIANAPNVVTDGDTALVELTVTAADPYDGVSIVNPGPDANLGAPLSNNSLDSTGVITTVFDDEGPAVGGDGIEVFSTDGYIFESAVLNIAKSSSIISDPVNSGFAIPGAIVEYTVTITNDGTSSTTSLVITDDLQVDLNFESTVPDYDLGGGENVQITFTDDDLATTTTSACIADGNNADGCELIIDGGGVGVDRLVITVPNLDPNDSVDVQFRVEIDNT